MDQFDKVRAQFNNGVLTLTVPNCSSNFFLPCLYQVSLSVFQHAKELNPATVAILTQTDYDRHMALVALDRSSEAEKKLGLARIIADPDIFHCEFSIMIGDQWHGQGIGAMLLYYLLKAAKQQEVESL